MGSEILEPGTVTRGNEALAWIFGTAIFLAALLLLSVQPMIGKMVLPLLGGAPAVWNTCMVFFQMCVLAGYAAAHLGGRRLGVRRQAALHVVLLVPALLLLPIMIPAGLAPPSLTGAAPAFWLFGRLSALAGLPLVVAAMTAPLLQRWFSTTGHARSRDPYFLYAASNAGSLLGLAIYPWLIERTLPLTRQSRVWAVGFAGLCVLILACAVMAARGKPEARGGEEAEEPCDPAPDARQVGRWVVLALIPSSWLLGVTTYLTTDLAAIPLLWTIPLGLYLLTYIVAFAGPGRWGRIAPALLPLLAVPLVLVLSAGLVQLFWIPLHLLTFLVGALVCHGQLADSRPGPAHLTAFYLAIALGGVLGGAFNALAAPLVFDRVVEYPLAVVLACWLAPPVAGPRRSRGAWSGVADAAVPLAVFGLTAVLGRGGREVLDSTWGMAGAALAAGIGLYACVSGLRRPLRFALALAAVLLASGLARSPGGWVIHRDRGFFGTLKVLDDPEARVHRLMHGSTLHGQQQMDVSERGEPTTYYTRSGPLGQVFSAAAPRWEKQEDPHIAVVGLGAGTTACYARPGQAWTFYEIDPSVIRIAEDPRLFTYLADCRSRVGQIEIVVGDARLRLRHAPDRRYQLLVLDAFSSDAVPVHLLSREAVELYRSKLAEGGLLAFNISNRYLDLEPVLGLLARDAGLVCRVQSDHSVTADQKRAGKQPSVWAVMARREADLGALAGDARWKAPRMLEGGAAWTDDSSDLVTHIVFGGRRLVPASTPPEARGEASLP